MDATGYIRPITLDQPQRQDEVLIPSEQVEATVNMTRADRRRRYRALRKAEKKVLRAALEADHD